LPDVATDNHDGPENATTPGTSLSPPEEEDNPELVIRRELEAISCMTPSPPVIRREETLSPLSVLEEEDNSELVIKRELEAISCMIPSSSVIRREETFSPLSVLEEDMQEQSVGSESAIAVNVPATEPRRRSKRKSNGFTSRKQRMKKLKMETGSIFIPTKESTGPDRQYGSRSANQKSNKLNTKLSPKSRSKPKSESAAPSLYDWPTITSDKTNYRVSLDS
jgi:hypothetical protein